MLLGCAEGSSGDGPASPELVTRKGDQLELAGSEVHFGGSNNYHLMYGSPPPDIGHGWLVATPLVTARELIDVMYNDSALSHAHFHERNEAEGARRQVMTRPDWSWLTLSIRASRASDKTSSPATAWS